MDPESLVCSINSLLISLSFYTENINQSFIRIYF